MEELFVIMTKGFCKQLSDAEANRDKRHQEQLVLDKEMHTEVLKGTCDICEKQIMAQKELCEKQLMAQKEIGAGFVQAFHLTGSALEQQDCKQALEQYLY